MPTAPKPRSKKRRVAASTIASREEGRRAATPAAQAPDIWYQVRKKICDIRYELPQGIVGPGFNDEFGDTYGIVYGVTADGFTQRELRDHVEEIRKRLLELPDISKIDILGAQDDASTWSFRPNSSRASGSTAPP
jgi:multidrug efflux pump subunit AcrB